MTGPIIINVHGQPAPQGSKRAFAIRKNGIPTGRVAVIESSHDRVKSWRQAVVDAALNLDTTTWPISGPLRLGIIFALPRPKGHYRTGKNANQLRDSAPQYPDRMPDLSKLLRSTEDALTDAGIWRDDAQVVAYSRLEKVYTGHYPQIPATGAMITITKLAATIGDGQRLL
ncbi:MAG: RusA family crossover junction endodeoxyribonuclease [Streptosporangiaceae bacterium]